MQSTPLKESLLIPAEVVVQQQLDAYNARNLETLVATYAETAEQHLLHAGLMASGREAIRKRMASPQAISSPRIRRTSDGCGGRHVFSTQLLTRSACTGPVRTAAFLPGGFTRELNRRLKSPGAACGGQLA